MRKFLELIGISWYSMGDKVLFYEIDGAVYCGHIQGHTEQNDSSTGWYRFSKHTYEIKICCSGAVTFINETRLIKRVSKK